MPNQDYVKLMSRYNRWQNESHLTAASGLAQEELKKNRHAFFDSIEGTLSHLLWADRLWMSRFANFDSIDGGIPDSTKLIKNWENYCQERRGLDQKIIQWADHVEKDWFSGELKWFSGALGRDVIKSKKILIVHFFNHQTHHRGQIHAMLTAAGAKLSDTDIAFMPDA